MNEEQKVINAALFDAISKSRSGDLAVDAVNAFVRSRIWTKRGMPVRGIFRRILEPSLLYEIIESVEAAEEADARLTPRELWYKLCHDERSPRRSRRNGIDAYLWDDRNRQEMRVAVNLLAQIRCLGGGNRAGA